jgi:hypothetical protein
MGPPATLRRGSGSMNWGMALPGNGVPCCASAAGALQAQKTSSTAQMTSPFLQTVRLLSILLLLRV